MSAVEEELVEGATTTKKDPSSSSSSSLEHGDDRPKGEKRPYPSVSPAFLKKTSFYPKIRKSPYQKEGQKKPAKGTEDQLDRWVAEGGTYVLVLAHYYIYVY